jgi:hypothetical protein
VSEYVLDNRYPYPEDQDSLEALIEPDMVYWHTDQDFRTYLMWNPGTDGSIDVPLRVLSWFWQFDVVRVSENPSQFEVLNPDFSGKPAGGTIGSQETTTHPEWTRNIINIEWLDDPP